VADEANVYMTNDSRLLHETRKNFVNLTPFSS